MSVRDEWNTGSINEKALTKGRLAQLVERYPYKVDVTGSSPVVPTIFCDICTK